jgi:hypothetical protein
MDGLCCPSRTSFASYAVEWVSGAPVLQLAAVSTSANRPDGE